MKNFIQHTEKISLWSILKEQETVESSRKIPVPNHQVTEIMIKKFNQLRTQYQQPCHLTLSYIGSVFTLQKKKYLLKIFAI